MEQKLSRFKELYPDYAEWKAKVWDPLLAIVAPKVPTYLDDTKMIYPPAMIFHLFDNRYSEFICVNSDDKTNKLFINALLHTLPTLYAKTQVLTPEAMDLLKPDTLFKNIEKRFNDDAENKFAKTETTYSSTPSGEMAAGTFLVKKPKEKNIINRVDASVRVKEITNYLSKLQELANAPVSGYVDDFINSIEFSSLFIALDEHETRYIVEINTKFGDGSSTMTQMRALTPDEFEKLKHVGQAVFRDGSNTNTQKRALRDDEFQKLTQGGTFRDLSLTNTQKRAVKDEEFTKLDEGVITRVQYDQEMALKQDNLNDDQKAVIEANPFSDAFKAQVEANTLKVSFSDAYKAQVEANTLKKSFTDAYKAQVEANNAKKSFTDAYKAFVEANNAKISFTDIYKDQVERNTLKVSFSDNYKQQVEANTLKKSFTDDYKQKVDNALPKAEADAKYEPLTTFFTPTTSHQAGYIIVDETGIKNVIAVGTQIKLDLKGIDDMIADPTQLPAAGDRLFIGIHGAVRIPNAGGTAALKWETKTNPTDINVKDNYKDKYFVLKKISEEEYDFVRLEDKPQVAPKPHWETIDQTTYNFTEPVRIRLTFSRGAGIETIIVDGNFYTPTNILSFAKTLMVIDQFGVNIIDYVVWRSDSADKTKIDFYSINGAKHSPPHLQDITKFEIWKEA